MTARRALVAGLVLAALTGGGLAVLAAGDGGGEPTATAAEKNERDRTTEPGAAAPTSESTGPIRFALADRYVTGQTINVVIENVGRSAYVYQLYYQACLLMYFDSSGRQFIIPPGTHCDLLAKQTIRPGERKRLFTWNLDECVKDRWGCVKSRPLPPGTYTIKGRFKPKAAGTPARAETTFTIVAA